MASKLDQGIARVAIVAASRDRQKTAAAAADAAAALTAKEVTKIPDRWYPAISAKGAGSPDLKDGWDHLWFEALAEILYQRKALPELLALMDREDSTYHDQVVVRLLRLAADGVEAGTIPDRVRARLAAIHYVKAREVVREVVYWSDDDPRPLSLLKAMVGIVLPNSDGDTIGLYLEQMAEEFAVHKARMREQMAK